MTDNVIRIIHIMQYLSSFYHIDALYTYLEGKYSINKYLRKTLVCMTDRIHYTYSFGSIGMVICEGTRWHK